MYQCSGGKRVPRLIPAFLARSETVRVSKDCVVSKAVKAVFK